MLGIRLPHDLEDRLNKLAASTNRSKSYYAKKALEQFLDDQEDYLLAVGALEKDNGKRYTLDEAKKILELDDEN